MHVQKTLDGSSTEFLDCRVRNSAFYSFFPRKFKHKFFPLSRAYFRPNSETKLTDYGIEV